jgi:ubiquinone/menaquinone biosynthesis C-methylase UbiE
MADRVNQLVKGVIEEVVMQDRTQMHAMWSAVAGHWERHAETVDARARAFTEQMLASADAQPGARILELACGPGGAGLAAASRFPSCAVVLSDVSPAMVAIAARRAGELGLSNVSTAVIDLEAIDQPAASFDVVLCREGLMFAADPGRAVGEMRRVLRPGGRLCVSVWGPRSRNPWLALVLDGVGAHLGRPVPPPGVPGPFSLDDAHTVESLLKEHDLIDVVVNEVDTPMRVATFDEWWSRTTSLAGPIAGLLAALPAEALAALQQRMQELVRPYETTNGLEFPGVNLLATARRA